MVTEETVETILRTLFLGGETVDLDRDASLLEEGICDSLGLVQIATEIEKLEPGIKIRDTEITRESFDSIRKIVEFIARKKR